MNAQVLTQIQPRPEPIRPILQLVPQEVRTVAPQQVSVRRARAGDVAAMFALLDHFAKRELLLPRSIQDVYRNVREFVVAVDENDAVVGCGGLRVYSPVLGEIVALAVDESCHGMGVGRSIVNALIEDARGMDMCRVFAMTLQEGFFHRLEFETTHITAFPEKITYDCSRCAKAKRCIEIAVARDI